jgi:membrane protein
MSKLRYGARVARLTIGNFLGDACLRDAAALSFYTLFSLAPVVMVSVQVASLFAAGVDFEQELVQQFTNLVGERGAEGVQVLLDTLRQEDASGLRLLVGALVLLFSATNIFVNLQDAFNGIFSVIPSGRSVIKKVLDRLISLGIILSLGLVMIMSLVIDSTVVLLQRWLTEAFPDLAVYVISAIQYLVLAFLATAEIYALLHFLPDVHLSRRYKLRGCALIALALLFGKSTIGWYIGNSSFGELGGAAASVIVLMLWIYYSSMIVFLGAEFIKAMAIADNVALHPKHYAVKVQSVIVEKDAAAPETAVADAPVIAPSVEPGAKPAPSETCLAAVTPAARAELLATANKDSAPPVASETTAPPDEVVADAAITAKAELASAEASAAAAADTAAADTAAADTGAIESGDPAASSAGAEDAEEPRDAQFPDNVKHAR